MPVRPGAGADRPRAEVERFTGTKRAAGPKLTADVVARSDAACVVIPGMSAWADEADRAAEGREPVGDGVAARVARRFLASAGCGLRAAVGRGLADGCPVGVPAGFLLPVGLGSGAGDRAGGGLAVPVGSGMLVRVGFGLAVLVGAGALVGVEVAVGVGLGLAVRAGCGVAVRVGRGVATGGLADARGWAGCVTVPDTPGMAALPGCATAGCATAGLWSGR